MLQCFSYISIIDFHSINNILPAVRLYTRHKQFLSAMHLLVIAILIILLLPLLSGHSYDNEPVSMDNDLEHSSTIYTSVCGDLDKDHDSYNDLVHCFPSNRTIRVEIMSCITYNERHSESDGDEYVAGSCPFNARNTNMMFDLSNITEYDELNRNVFCKSVRRDGTLCGSCKNDSALATNSYNMKCMDLDQCRNYNWLILILINHVPVTVFFVVVIVFHISITSGCANAYILYAQLVSLQINVLYLRSDWESVGTNLSVVVSPLIAVYSVWNLDLVKSLLPNMCLGSNINSMLAIMFQYFIAIYGLVLIITVYVLVELHARNVRLIVWLWRPFGMCFSRFRRQLNTKASLIDAFATFILLSYSKFTITSVMLLTPTELFNRTGSVVGHVLLYNGAVEYFGTKHLPLAVVAIIVVVIFVLLPPLAMILYPFKCVQRCLTRCRLHRPALVAFMDAFQGCYKDGTNGTRDLRFFSAVYFILRVVVFTVYIAFAQANLYPSLQYCNILIATALTVFVAVLRPYKKNLYNNIDTAMIAFCIVIASGCLYKTTVKKYQLGYYIFCYLLLSIPFLVAACYVLFRFCIFIQVNRCISHCVQRYGAVRRQTMVGRTSRWYLRKFSSECISPTCSIPDRLLRPEEYEDNVSVIARTAW